MLCDNCEEAEASVHQVLIQGNEVIHQHLCEACAEKSGEDADALQDDPLTQAFDEVRAEEEEEELQNCPRCGSNLEEIQKRGRAGCPECYSAFEDELGKLVKRIHGSGQHTGQASQKDQLSQVPRRKKIQTLEKELERCVRKEDYEEAAKLRDKISELKEEDQDDSDD